MNSESQRRPLLALLAVLMIPATRKALAEDGNAITGSLGIRANGLNLVVGAPLVY